ncbi:UvrD-helicase domain-containing protein [Acidithiobacillus sp. IBUN Pt1247-S3]|uniref:UvrD-helicase domain-containing protein n=1 Tax=Acidithiobacillus sp. IBUN Pt1247-S3 TaxID=3166642 RepID=UPI0034E3C91A
MANFNPTDEQAEIVSLASLGASVSVSAFAGAGKTSTQVLVAKALLAKRPNRTIHYFAFNSTMAKEAAGKFPDAVKTSTAHALAYNAPFNGSVLGNAFRGRTRCGKKLRDAVIANHAKRIDDLREFGLAGGAAVSSILDTVRNFCYSDALTISSAHAPGSVVSIIKALGGGADVGRAFARTVAEAATEVWRRMSDLRGDYPSTDDVYLKLWAMYGDFSGFDAVLFDEAQDANPVMISALKKMRDAGAQIILVGDRHQSIYGWRGAVDAMNLFGDFRQAALTESFRFGENIAAPSRLFLDAAGEDRELRGRNPNPGFHSDSKKHDHHPDAILCRSNAGVIFSALRYIRRGKMPYIEGGGEAAAKLLSALRSLYEGRPAYGHPELSLFHHWHDLVDYSETKEGGSYRPYVKIVESLVNDERGGDGVTALDEAIHALREGTARSRHSGFVTISTLHKAKGLEWPCVRLGEDWTKTHLVTKYEYLGKSGDVETAYGVNQESYKLLYVAWTRAQERLETNGLQAIYEEQATLLQDFPVTPEIRKKAREYRNWKAGREPVA